MSSSWEPEIYSAADRLLTAREAADSRPGPGGVATPAGGAASALAEGSGSRYLTPDEVAALLTVDRKVVYRLIKSGRLPALRVGRLFRVDPADLRSLAVSEAPAPPVAGRSKPSRQARPALGEFGRLARQTHFVENQAGGAA